MTETKLPPRMNRPANGVKTPDVTSVIAEGAEHDVKQQVVSTQAANKDLIDYMKQILEDGRQEAQHLRRKHEITFWLLILLSTVMFLMGLVLLTGPIWFPLWLQAEWPITGGSAVLGALDLYALYQLKPLARIQKLMGDISQMTVTFNSFQLQVALRLLETNIQERRTIGDAADHLKSVANEAILMIDEHFEKWLNRELDVDPSTRPG